MDNSHESISVKATVPMSSPPPHLSEPEHLFERRDLHLKETRKKVQIAILRTDNIFKAIIQLWPFLEIGARELYPV